MYGPWPLSLPFCLGMGGPWLSGQSLCVTRLVRFAYTVRLRRPDGPELLNLWMRYWTPFNEFKEIWSRRYSRTECLGDTPYLLYMYIRLLVRILYDVWVITTPVTMSSVLVHETLVLSTVLGFTPPFFFSEEFPKGSTLKFLFPLNRSCSSTISSGFFYPVLVRGTPIPTSSCPERLSPTWGLVTNPGREDSTGFHGSRPSS